MNHQYFSQLEACLSSSDYENDFVINVIKDDSLIERIRQVLLTKPFRKSDLKPLIRHLLLRETSRLNSGIKADLRVPKQTDWPSVSEWNEYGITAMPVEQDLLLSANEWFPDWLDHGVNGVFTDAFSEVKVREESKCKTDPFVEDVTGYAYYSSPGQREAVRATFLIPNGETLVVNLPTGSGKSLVGQIPALVKGEGNITLFVVPTVALAIDQARQMQKYFEKTESNLWPLAWYGGASDHERAEIRERIGNGTQRILFTSPEALTGSLLRLVFKAAENGFLRYLVIDEAHLITQWGDEFRPAFQALAGLRNSLLKILNDKNMPPFRTLLLSATFTLETIDTLANLFGPASKVQMIAAVHTRPEPQYWCKRVDSKDEKKMRVLEALRYAPRPFILYVTKINEAIEWYDLLKSTYQRIERFDGNTNDSKRKEIIDAWVANKLDGIVATSAFGVGMDKGDVRTIIHAAIPETLDRFYQEVGRGGRDGCHSISLLIYQDEDWSVAKSMSNPTLISEELGFLRWSALFESRRQYPNHNDELFRVNIEAVRDGINGSNDENIRWNMRTLLLMSRAGLLKLAVEPNFEDEIESESLLAIMSVVRVRLLTNGHMLVESWEDAIRTSRAKTLNTGQTNLALLRNVIEDKLEVSDVLSELYDIKTTEWLVNVTKVCGGCITDRLESTKIYNIPIPNPIDRFIESNFSVFVEKFPYLKLGQVINVFYDANTSQLDFINLLNWLIRSCNIQEVFINADSKLANTNEWKNLYRSSPLGVVLQNDLYELQNASNSPLGSVTFFDRQITNAEYDKLQSMNKRFNLVFYQSDTIDPQNKFRLMSELQENQIVFSTIYEGIQV